MMVIGPLLLLSYKPYTDPKKQALGINAIIISISTHKNNKCTHASAKTLKIIITSSIPSTY